jgi:hypothetical protein
VAAPALAAASAPAVALTDTVADIAAALSVAVVVLRTAPVAPTTWTLKVPAASPVTLNAPVAVVTAVPTTVPAAFTTFTVTAARGPAGPLAVPAMSPTSCACARADATCASARLTISARASSCLIVVSLAYLSDANLPSPSGSSSTRATDPVGP